MSTSKGKMTIIHVDLETTGLDPRTHQIVEIGAIIDDTSYIHKPINELKTYHGYVKQNPLWIDPYCLAAQMARQAKVDAQGLGIASAIDHFARWISDNTYLGDKLVLCGKNVMGFDFQFLRAAGFVCALEKYNRRVGHRAWDIGNLFARPDDDVIPDLRECCERAGLSDTTVKHEALADAILTYNCWHAWRKAYTF